MQQKKKRLRIKDKKLKTLLQSGGKDNARKEFFEILKLAVKRK
jgi:hypothetical protein